MTLARRVAALAAVLLLTGCTVANAGTVPGPGGASPSGSAPAPVPADPTVRGPHRVATAAYDLGDSALRVPGFFAVDRATGGPDRGRVAPIEVRAVVHHPAGAGGGPYPLVVILHGDRETCADRAAAKRSDAAYRAAVRGDREAAAALDEARAALVRWPCAPGTPPVAGFRGYDYLGERLASHGMVAVSVSANGVAAGAAGPAQDAARAALVNRHLELWQQVGTPGGPRFTDPATGAPRAVDLGGGVDLTRVVTVGHGRGGNGVAWHAADAHRSAWPRGVTVRAVLALAPAYAAEPDGGDAAAYRVAVPLATFTGSCDSVGRAGAPNLLDLAGDAARGVVLTGGNHNAVTTAPAPAGGRVLSGDDVELDLIARGDARPAPGACRDAAGGDRTDRQLPGAEQRSITAAYVTGFAGHALLPERFPADPFASEKRPFAALTTMDEPVVRGP
jgi:hypothetical protein